MRIILKSAKILAIFFCALYGFYVVSVAVFLNTPLFAFVTDMKEEDTTHIRFRGALSAFPGHLWVWKTKIAVRDQNVTIDIYAHTSTIWFDLMPIFEKRFHTRSVKISSATIDVRMKTIEDKTEFIKKHTTPKSNQLALRIEEVKENKKTRMKLEFPKIVIQKITSAMFPFGEIIGELSLEGAFNIQPGVEVTVLPSLLSIKNAVIKDQFDKINGTALVEFTTFVIPESPGNVVLPHVNADIELSAFAYSLKSLDITLRSLPGYTFSGGRSNVQTKLKIRNGEIQPGSLLETSPSNFGIHSADFDAIGTAYSKWEASKGFSIFDIRLKNAKVALKSSNLNKGSVKRLDLHLKLFGNELLRLFEGIALELDLNQVNWQFADQKKEVTGKANGGGKILGHSGIVPQQEISRLQKLATPLTFRFGPVRIKNKIFLGLYFTGDVKALSRPINFTNNKIDFDEVRAELKISMDYQESTTSKVSLEQLQYTLNPFRQWKGKANFSIQSTGPFIDALKKQDKISGMVALLANVSDLNINADWESGPHLTWIRINRASSSGIWSAYGSFLDSKLKNGTGMRGIFEVRVAGLPVGIRIEPNETKVSFLPTEKWYDEFLLQPETSSHTTPP